MSDRDMSGGQAVVTALCDEGVETMFGIPGTHNLQIYRHLPGSGIRHVTPRHEQGGGYAADGYARASGRPGIVQATTGPGVLNAITPAATAWADSVPMVVLSPSLPTTVEGRDSGYLHETKDQHGALSAVVAASYRPLTPAATYAAVRDAITVSRSARARPSHVGIPLDVLDAIGPVDRRPAAPVTRPTTPDPDVIEDAARLLSGARRPVLVAGGGARGATGPVRRLAERLGVAVITTVNGKGILDEAHPLALGASLRLKAAKDWLQTADVVLAVGTELGESDTWQPTLELSGTVIRIDVDAGQLDSNAVATVTVHADAAEALQAILAAATATDRARPATELAAVKAAIVDEALADGAAFTPLCTALQEALGTDGLLVADSTMATYFGAVHLLEFATPGRLLYPTGYATLGYALPAAIGVKTARPDAPVVVLSGDGGLMFTIAELVTAVEQRLALPVVVLNNGGYGEIRRQMHDACIEPLGVDLRVPDLVALARACGAHAASVTDPSELSVHLDRALGQDLPTLIEIAGATT